MLYLHMVDVQSAIFRKLSNIKREGLTVHELLDQAEDILKANWFSSESIQFKVEFDSLENSSKADKFAAATLYSESDVANEGRVYCTIQYTDRDLFEQIIVLERECRELLNLFTSVLASRIKEIFLQQKLSEKHRLLDNAYKLAKIGTWEYNMKTEKLYWSPITKHVHGFGDDHIPDVEHTISLFKEGFDRETFAKAAHDAIEHEIPFDLELKIISGQGDERWIRATGEPEYKNGECVRFYGISQNVTNRKQAQEHLQKSKERFKALVQDGADMIVILNDNAVHEYVSTTVESVLGYHPDELLHRSVFGFIHPDDRDRLEGIFSAITSETKRLEIEPYRFRNSSGEWRWIETTVTDLREEPAVGGIVANSRDITYRKKQETKLLESLLEKEMLLAEIHHRVKNNLSIVISLLRLHENKGKHEPLFKELISRIQTMSQIHEQLYKSEHFARLNFTENIKQLVENIITAFQSDTNITILSEADPVELSINQAIPCSLIINEVVTNCMKHAFDGKESGTIKYKIFEKQKDVVYIEIVDNGVGLPKNFDKSSQGSLGMSLIKGLSNELKAEFLFNTSKQGTRFTLHFKKE